MAAHEIDVTFDNMIAAANRSTARLCERVAEADRPLRVVDDLRATDAVFAKLRKQINQPIGNH